MNQTEDINKKLIDLGLDDYGIKELKPLFHQVCHSLAQITEAGNIKEAFWGQVILNDAKMIGMIVALENALLIIGVNPLNQRLYSIQFPYSEIKELKEYRNKDTNVIMDWIFNVQGKTYTIRGLKGFVPSKVLSYIYEQIKKINNQ